jgi:hypothetical protein
VEPGRLGRKTWWPKLTGGAWQACAGWSAVRAPGQAVLGCAFVRTASSSTGGLRNLQVVTGAERWPLCYHGEQSTR